MGGAKNLVTPWRSIASSTAAGSAPGRMWLDAPSWMSGTRKQCCWAQWNSGIACSSTSSRVMPPSMTQLAYWAISAAWDSTAPFGRDSVPEV